MIYKALGLALLVGAIVGYIKFVRWQMSRTVATRYNSVVAQFIPKNRVVSLWRTVYLKDVRQQLTPIQWTHELWHIKHHWARWPYTFLFRVLFDYALHGYDRSRFENEARKAAGQPTR